MGSSLVQIACSALIFSIIHAALAGFGDDISQDNEDNRFAVMGQVTTNTFEVVDGNIQLILDVEDTKDIAELWILDFEPYRFNEDALPIDELTGELLVENTGECSSVYESVEWTFFNDDYFKDRNAAQLAAKSLFTTFEYGGEYGGNNTRTDKIKYTGPLSNFFDCKKSDGFTDVWEKTSLSSDDEIEYKTRLYATNVRPKDPEDNAAGISFVQSHIVLIWRLSRQAIGNFIISSTAILRPLIDFARVAAVYDSQGDPIPELARLHLRFTTILDDSLQQLAYSATGFTFKPDNPLHGRNATWKEPQTSLANAPDCTLKLDIGTGQHMQCHQTWDFILILNIDTTNQLVDSIPVDASATMDFYFDVYDCNGTCSKIQDDAQVTTLITIQTVVFIRDAEEDQFTLILMALEGANGHTLDATQPGSRPVSHKEDVTLKVKFSPAVLRDQFSLKLMLFMVCKGDVQGAQGCLDSPVSERYVASVDPSFSYTVDVNGTEVTYSNLNLTEDYVQPLSDSAYLTDTDDDDHHKTEFTNVALSAESSNYTITTVYNLIETGRRKREIAALKVIRSGSVSSTSYSTRVAAIRRERDIEDSAADFHGFRAWMTASGCPKRALHIPELFDCACPADTIYDLLSFECVDHHDQYDIDQDPADVDVDLGDDDKSGGDHTTPTLLIILGLNVVIIQIF